MNCDYDWIRLVVLQWRTSYGPVALPLPSDCGAIRQPIGPRPRIDSCTIGSGWWSAVSRPMPCSRNGVTSTTAFALKRLLMSLISGLLHRS